MTPAHSVLNFSSGQLFKKTKAFIICNIGQYLAMGILTHIKCYFQLWALEKYATEIWLNISRKYWEKDMDIKKRIIPKGKTAKQAASSG